MQIGSSHLSMLRRQSMWLVFEFAHLVTGVSQSVVGLFPANLQCTFPRSADSNSKTSKNKIAWLVCVCAALLIQIWPTPGHLVI